MLAPYTDTTLYPLFDISTVPGCANFIAGFIVADSSNQASWGGYHKIETGFYADIFKKIRAKGGDITVSFGGASGRELATVLKSDGVFNEYKRVIDKYALKSIDLDIEGSAINDLESCKQRGDAIIRLKRVFPKLKVSLTVPVMPYGLSKETLACMNVTPHDLLNIMAMDFGNESDMGSAVVSAIKATLAQTQKDVGVTVMIGVNDTNEIFSIQAAKFVKEYIKKTPRVKRLSFWSIERDTDQYGPLAKSSQILQPKWGFTKIFS